MSMAAAYGTDDEAQDSSTEVADLKSAMRESLQSLTQGLLEATAGDHAQVEMTAVDWANQSQQLDELFDEQAKNRLALLPAYAMPPQFKNLQLYDYQQDGIRWLIHQERNQNAVAPWFKEVSTLAGKKYKCCITGALLPRPPKAVCGGILADDMGESTSLYGRQCALFFILVSNNLFTLGALSGLGKTLQTIGLILSNPPAGQRYPYRRQGIAARPAPRCTLIICPVSVIGNWYFQVNKHVNNKVPDKALKIRSYHGPKRGPMLDAAKSNDVDILVTSYHTIVADLKKILEEEQSQLKSKKRKKSCTTSIFDIVFHRIVLDEAHIIRNSETGFFKAVACLHGERKLCLTGTPFVNKPDDLFSLLTFLDVRPLNSKKVWQKHVQEKIAERKDSGLATIRTTMAFVALRRKKSEVEHTIQLVSKEVQYRKITFPEGTHKIVHDILYASARSAFLGLLRLGDDTVALNFMALLELILRVRQSCCHADLVPEERRRNATEVYEEINRRGLDALTEEEGQQLLDRIRGTFEKEDELEECAICLCEMEEESTVILRNCKHIFCQACINKVQNYCCPLCRISYTEEDMIKKSAAQTAAAGENKKPAAVKLQGGGGTQTGRPPKIQAMLDAIEEMDPDEKGKCQVAHLH
jgi:SWI/SNF-related matrix-associated actin-dependent regulator of chromatin subfamily A3